MLRVKWAQLLLDYIRVLAWPSVGIAFVLLFRTQLASLVGNLKEASGLGVTLKFEKDARQVETASRSLRLLPKATTPKGKRQLMSTEAIAPTGLPTPNKVPEDGISSVGEIMRAWAQVEGVVAKLSDQMGLHSARPVNIQLVVEELEKQGHIGGGALEVVRNLQRMRNQLVHDPDMVLTASAADSLLSAIRELKNTLTQIGDHL